MKKTTAVPVLLALLLLIPSATLAFTAAAPVSTIKLKAIAETKIPVTITSTSSDVLTATILDAKPWMGLNETQFAVQPGTRTVDLVVTPFPDVILGVYGIPIVFKSLVTSQEQRVTVFINVERGDVLNIERITISGSFEPLGSARVSVPVRNYKPVSVDAPSLFVRVTSPDGIILSEFTHTFQRLDPDETEAADFNLFFEKNAPAGSYEVYARLSYLSETDEYRQTFDLQSKPLIQRESRRSPTLFGFEKRIILTNNGNAAGEEIVTEYLSSVESAFFSGDTPTLKTSGVYTWVVRGVQPGETRYVVYRIDYTPLFLLIIALLIGAWIFFFKLRTIRVRKHILHKKKIEAGEEFTIAVEVMNKLGGKIDVAVSDFVPAVFDVKDAEGGVRPARKKTHAGTELTWHVRGLNMNEARILTYKIIPVFGVHGVLKLPKSTVSFKWRNRQMRNSSASPAIGLSAEGAEDALRKLVRKRK
jgi:hypothetical protein